MDEAAKEVKRAEIMAKVAAARAAQEAQEKAEAENVAKLNLFGIHTEITCDGCGTRPITGFRYKCRNQPNVDYCENCYEAWKGGVVNTMEVLPGRFSKSLLSKKAEDHLFEPFADHTLRRKGTEAPQEAKKEKKIKPNEPCPCNSGKKYKKCCGATE